MFAYFGSNLIHIQGNILNLQFYSLVQNMPLLGLGIETWRFWTLLMTGLIDYSGTVLI